MKKLCVLVFTILLVIALVHGVSGEELSGDITAEAIELNVPETEEALPVGDDAENVRSEDDFAVSASELTEDRFKNRRYIEVSGYLGQDLLQVAKALKMSKYYEAYSGEQIYFYNAQYVPFLAADGMNVRHASISSMEKYNWTTNYIADYYEIRDEEYIDLSAYPSLHFYGVYCGQSLKEAVNLLILSGWAPLHEYGNGCGIYMDSQGHRLEIQSSDFEVVWGVSIYTVKGWKLHNRDRTFDVLQEGKPAPTSISLKPRGTITVKKGSMSALTPSVKPSGAARLLKWKSSNTKVAQVTQWGLLKARKPGTAKITVTSKNGKKSTVIVKVVDSASYGLPVLNNTEKTMAVGDRFTLKVAQMADGSKIPKLTWTSSNKKTAKVDSEGKITAVGTGTSSITVKTAGGQKATCQVTVKNTPKKVSLNKTQLTINRGESYQLKAKLPEGTYTSKYTWTSSNKKVAKVSSNGKVKAVGEGTAIIKVKIANGKTARCKVTVNPADKSKYDLLNYLGKGLKASAKKLGWKVKREGSAFIGYQNAYNADCEIISYSMDYDTSIIKNISIYEKSRYNINGIKWGERKETAVQKMNLPGWTLDSRDENDESASFEYVNGDFYIRLLVKQGKVYDIMACIED